MSIPKLVFPDSLTKNKTIDFTKRKILASNDVSQDTRVNNEHQKPIRTSSNWRRKKSIKFKTRRSSLEKTENTLQMNFNHYSRRLAKPRPVVTSGSYSCLNENRDQIKSLANLSKDRARKNKESMPMTLNLALLRNNQTISELLSDPELNSPTNIS